MNTWESRKQLKPIENIYNKMCLEGFGSLQQYSCHAWPWPFLCHDFEQASNRQGVLQVKCLAAPLIKDFITMNAFNKDSAAGLTTVEICRDLRPVYQKVWAGMLTEHAHARQC